LQIIADECGKIKQAFSYVLHLVTCKIMNVLIVPDLKIQLGKIIFDGTIFKESLIFKLFQVFLIDIDRKDNGACGYHRRPIF
jgi:hypothetical protein